MRLKFNKDKWPLILGGLTLILFSSKPYILDFIEPTKSVGQVIGENARDLIDSLKGDREVEQPNSKREIWSNIISILAFALFTATIVGSTMTIQKGTKKWYGMGGALLAIVGIGIYISHLTIGLIAFIVIAILVVIVVTIEGL